MVVAIVSAKTCIQPSPVANFFAPLDCFFSELVWQRALERLPRVSEC